MNDPRNVIDINLADPDELTRLPGVGPSLAERIISGRPYHSLNDLTRVRGIGARALERLLPHLTITSAEEAPSLSGSGPPPEPQNAVPQQPGEEPDLESGESQEAETSMPEAQIDESEATTSSPIEEKTAGEIDAGAEAEAEIPDVQPSTEAPSEAEVAPKITSEEHLPEQPQPETPVEPAKPTPKFATRAGVFWAVLLSGALAFFIAVIVSLGLLVMLNGGLRYISPSQFAVIKRQSDGLKSQVAILQQDIDGLRNRMNNLEALSGRVDVLEEDTSQLSSEVEAANAQIETLDQQVTELATTVDELKTSTDRFQNFLNGLQELLSNLFSPEGGQHDN